MKTPWWLHVLVGVVIVSTVLLGWCHWMIRTRDHPTVVIHRHIYIPDTEERRICDCSQEFMDMREDIKDANEMSMAALQYTKNFGVYANSLFQRIEKQEADIAALDRRVTELEKKPKQRRGCGE